MFNEELKNKNLIIELESFEKILEREIIIRNWKEIELPSEKAKILAPIDVNVSLEKGESRVLVTGKIETMVQLHCSRCLKPIEYWIEESFEAVYLSRNFEKYLSKTERLKTLDNLIYYDGQSIDLTNRVIETIILSVPEVPLCREDCKGLCPICGTDLNENPDHSCETEEIDPRFVTLKKLLDNEKLN